jgi:hypothetical protein
VHTLSLCLPACLLLKQPCPRRSEIKLSNVWCIYGYSLTIFIPMAFVCIVPIGWVRWLVVGLATGGWQAAKYGWCKVAHVLRLCV